MKVVDSIEKYAENQSCALTIGTFDGVHIGHRKIIKLLVKTAKKNNCLAVVLTFFPHPRMVLQADLKVQLIDTLDEKQKILEELGVDILVIHPFSKAFSRQTAHHFIRNILVQAFHINHLIIGYDHRFGRNREATVEDLIQAGETYDFEVHQIEAQEIKEVNVSSTKIRNALALGNIQKATQYLSRPYSLFGKVVEGKKIGRTIGFPTANLSIAEDYKLVPADGVYFIKTIFEANEYFGMMNIGFRPTVEGIRRSYEVHLFAFNSNLYEENLTIIFLQQIRKEQKFDTLEDLKKQLEIDKAHCQNLIR